jgi:hypothetical protein
VTAEERRILAALTINHTAAVMLLNRRIIQREQPTTTDNTNATKD